MRSKRMAWIVAVAALLLVLVVAATNTQAQAKPTGVTASSTDEGHIEVSWDDDDAPVHRVGWTNDRDFREAHAAGDWLEAFHFADTKGESGYTVKYLPGGQPYWFIVGAAPERFGGASWSDDWAYLITPVDPSTEPALTPESTPIPSAANTCDGDDYDRDEWGDYPAADSSSTPRWTLPSDNVSASDITQDHHVALKDAHISGGCDWSATKKDEFSSDAENLNTTTRSFNSSKANRTPDMLTGIAMRIIDTDAERCDYATQHDEVKEKYDLNMTEAEQDTVDEWLALCP